MKKPVLQPMDIIVIDGLWLMPHHDLIMWRGLDPASHVVTCKDDLGNIWSPEFTGIKDRHISHYAGRKLSVHRFKNDCDIDALLADCYEQQKESKGYDFRQWGMGFVLGITNKEYSDNSDQYTCAEFPYIPWQKRHSITEKEEVLPMPRLFRYNNMFKQLFYGVW